MCDARHRESSKEVLVTLVEHVLELAQRRAGLASGAP
jgi:hypothetical protein